MKIATLSMLMCMMASAELLRNPDFESVEADTFTGWTTLDFRTGGTCLIGTAGGHSGRNFAICRSVTKEQREAWLQRRPLPGNSMAVLVGGWYRTSPEVKSDSRTGASLRVHWYDANGKEISLEQRFFADSTSWTEVKDLLFLAPSETAKVELQLFHWLTPGETHWDDVSLKVIDAEETTKNRELFAQLLGIDREPVFGVNMPYSPAEGEVVATNPPPLRWLPCGRARSYAWQLCRDADFQGATLLERKNYPWLVDALDKPLEAGTWYWRYGAEVPPLGIVWSRSRQFTVLDNSFVWPYPAMSAFRVSQEHPRLFVKPGGLAKLRERATVGDLKGTTGWLLKRVQDFAQEELIAEPDFLPEKGQARSQAYTAIFRATRPPMDRMEQAALAYLLTGDKDAGAEARRRVLHFFSWDPKGSTNTFHNDEPAMWIMMRGCRAYDWTYQLYTAEERRLVENSMTERARDIYRLLRRKPFDNNPYESHLGRQIGFLGEAAVALYNEVPEAKDWLQYIVKIYWGVYPAWGREDGGWNEGPHYWGAYMGFALHFVVALREATGIDLSRKPFFANTPYYCLYQVPPLSRISPFGDGTQMRAMTQQYLMYCFSSLLKDSRLRWYSEQYHVKPGGDILGIALTEPDIPAREPVDIPSSRYFPFVGLVCSHTDLTDRENDIALYFRSTPYGAVSHGHNDQNCFAIEAFGEPLAIPTGHYNYYGSPHHDLWMRATKGKCGITYDNSTGQKRGWQYRGKITRYYHDNTFDSFAGDATEAYGGDLEQAVREIVRVRPNLIVIRDTLKSRQPRSFEYWLHAYDKMAVDKASQQVVTTRTKAMMKTDFLLPGNLSFEQTDQFDPPPVWPPDKNFENYWHLKAVAAPARETTFLTVLQPRKVNDTTPEPALQLVNHDGTQGVEAVYHDNTRIQVVFGKDGVKATVKKPDGAIQAALVQE